VKRAGRFRIIVRPAGNAGDGSAFGIGSAMMAASSPEYTLNEETFA